MTIFSGLLTGYRTRTRQDKTGQMSGVVIVKPDKTGHTPIGVSGCPDMTIDIFLKIGTKIMVTLSEALEFLLSQQRKDDPRRYDRLKRRLLYAIKSKKVYGFRNRHNKRWFCDIGDAVNYAHRRNVDLC